MALEIERVLAVTSAGPLLGGLGWRPVVDGRPSMRRLHEARHLVPDARSIAAMGEPAKPALLLFPSFGFEGAEREVFPSECFVRLTQASTNYVALGEAGFDALTGLVRGVPARAIDYPDTDGAIALVERLWGELA